MLTKKWQFDSEVAARFYSEATSNIPDYEKVISICDQVLALAIAPTGKILDVGSAIGHTVKTLTDRGWRNVYGLEKSPSMAAASECPERIIVGDRIPNNVHWDAILINWTLHFIQDKASFIQQAWDSLVPGGILIISDKVEYTEAEALEYHQFKKSNGLSDDYIDQKAKALEGVMFLKPENWYYQVLTKTGFEDVSLVNSRYMFKTFVCRKPK